MPIALIASTRIDISQGFQGDTADGGSLTPLHHLSGQTHGHEMAC